MTRTMNLVWKLRIWKDTKGQDLHCNNALMRALWPWLQVAIMPGGATNQHDLS